MNLNAAVTDFVTFICDNCLSSNRVIVHSLKVLSNFASIFSIFLEHFPKWDDVKLTTKIFNSLLNLCKRYVPIASATTTSSTTTANSNPTIQQSSNPGGVPNIGNVMERPVTTMINSNESGKEKDSNSSTFGEGGDPNVAEEIVYESYMTAIEWLMNNQNIISGGEKLTY